MKRPTSRRSLGSINDDENEAASVPAHLPVLFEEALVALAVHAGGLYVDATYGGGGHTRGIVARGGRVIAFERDPAAQPAAGPRGDVTLLRRDFADLAAALDEFGIATIDGALFDVGLSSLQLADPERGFSLLRDGPLDMRLNPSGGPTAYDLLARSSEAELADLIFNNGEERAARRIARAIVAARQAGRLPHRTLELARLVAGVVQRSGKRERIHPATRTFQALRITVNDELGALDRGLAAAAARLRPGGRIAAISFHSLEDRIVKRRFRDDERLRVITRKPLLPSDDELARNPRSRSAKLRVAERLSIVRS
ncbi:MAG: 16S rRNA (cytosine(1402)-N(4))-methyltransferase RsmH [Candidatus Eremiobacteraeota bacterium]|nr:16S rRNA (cytosine(1402)-N(4))-methyltransferase RsmH [Candidatus Eremiobacteraeota bacterium]MBC5803492.1 16S rRNA (cytosine(1402)-N(4))-methyltransferase RsmH [Candidatus Eremiobacteraeota bacterium]MBC5820461.1 16S rRNA (cytosine(1402)-N(4))-methyltransferase RsmH [Candidatus Eremiobacteraeota bacterium]